MKALGYIPLGHSCEGQAQDNGAKVWVDCSRTGSTIGPKNRQHH